MITTSGIEILDSTQCMAFRYQGRGTDYKLTYVSNCCMSVIGHDAAELEHFGFGQFRRLVHHEDVVDIARLYDVTLAVGLPLETTFRLITKAGEEKRLWVRVCITDCDDDGMPFVFEGVAIDMTKQLHFETTKLANRAKYDFLARISHELRTPMNAIIGMAEMGLREASREKLLDYTQIIKQAGTKLMSVLSDILDFSKIETNELTMQNEEYILSSLLSDTVANLREQMLDTPLTLSIDIDSNLPNILVGDMTRLRQVLLCVMSNAVKFTDIGTIALCVSGTASDNMLDLTIRIEDTGRGIIERDMKSIFKPFTQFDIKTGEGIGLGLAIAKNLISIMKGNIYASSVYGVGSIFTIDVQQEIIGDETVGDIGKVLGKITHEPMKPTFIAPTAKVLVVDDIGTNLKVATGLLRPFDMQVDTCISGAEAIAAVQTTDYDLVFMDHMMPIMNGLQATSIIRSMGVKVPIIALTANAVYGMREMFLRNGFDDFLSKPIEVAKLNETIEKWIPAEKQCPFSPDETIATEITLNFPGIDVEKGLEYMSGDTELYIGVVASFCENARSMHNEILDCVKNKDLENYAIHMHTIKGTAGSIGAIEISNAAEKLENAANENNFDYVTEHTAHFLTVLVALLDEVEPALKGGLEA